MNWKQFDDGGCWLCGRMNYEQFENERTTLGKMIIRIPNNNPKFVFDAANRFSDGSAYQGV